jgi:2-keto-4-pentenoate hydratase/2-oxohepta-3-ene-1,7-dioic acid hydratase in catechol pathway
MKIALVRVPESATPRLAIACDGALYDVAELEAGRAPGLALPTDFHARVFGLGCAGLQEAVDRLRSGLRPSRARLGPHQVVLEPPCDVDRVYACQLGPHDGPATHPQFRLLDGRGLRGDGALVPFPADAAHAVVEGSVAALLGEDLHLAAADEAARAVLGYSLMVEWGCSAPERPWLDRQPWDVVAVQLGPVLVTGDEIGELGALTATVTVGEESWPVGPFGCDSFSAAEAIAFVSQHVQLRAGDVVGLGRLRHAMAFASGRARAASGISSRGDRVAAELGAGRTCSLRPGAWFQLAAAPFGALRGRYS